MLDTFESFISTLMQTREDRGPFSGLDLSGQFERGDSAGGVRGLNAAFLIALAGRKHPLGERAREFIEREGAASKRNSVAGFYLEGLARVSEELDRVWGRDPDCLDRLQGLCEWVSRDENLKDPDETAERIWGLFFPEGKGIRGREREGVRALREKRAVRITALNPRPVSDPAGEILFTSNALLTPPAPSEFRINSTLGRRLREKLLEIAREPQVYWYDHPVEIGAEIEKNEVVYGLRGLEAAMAFERERGNVADGRALTCLLSVSVTHRGLQGLAREILREELDRAGMLRGIDLYAFTEADTTRIREDILVPAALRYLNREDGDRLLRVFGVDGEYGRHYSFLKAVAPFWQILINPEIKGTFKIDLDQVFPQRELVEQTGSSAFEHLKTPLWGARGLDWRGRPLELGMIAGALVNDRDLDRSIFTPDVPFPGFPPSPDEYVFFSALPQALSSEAEMMMRYPRGGPEVGGTCIQRVHVTGGTTGILVESLRRHRPFTPSFIGRAEDQAYIMSVLSNPGERLAYAHKDGLIMRHDKESFAQDAIRSARVSKLIGDYIRILYFSAYGAALGEDIVAVKEVLDPFTGCFISRTPVTVVFLRFALRAAAFFAAGEEEVGREFVEMGAKRILKGLRFSAGSDNPLRARYEMERRGWDLYYDILSVLEGALKGGDDFALGLREDARALIGECSLLHS